MGSFRKSPLLPLSILKHEGRTRKTKSTYKDGRLENAYVAKSPVSRHPLGFTLCQFIFLVQV